MDIIEMTRELARKLQQEDSYILLNTTQQAVEDDEALQEAIADFNMKRYELTQEVTKKDRDDEKIDELDKLVRGMYDDITNNEKMVAYNNAQDDFNEMFEYVLHILQMAATGDDPDSIEKPEAGGGCSVDSAAFQLLVNEIGIERVYTNCGNSVLFCFIAHCAELFMGGVRLEQSVVEHFCYFLFFHYCHLRV